MTALEQALEIVNNDPVTKKLLAKINEMLEARGWSKDIYTRVRDAAIFELTM